MATVPTRMAVAVAPERIPDSYGNAPPAEVRRMAYVLNLIFGYELDQAGDFDLIPVARLMREGDRITPRCSVCAPLSDPLRLIGAGHHAEGDPGPGPGPGAPARRL